MRMSKKYVCYAVGGMLLLSGCGDHRSVEKQKEAVRKTTDPVKVAKIAIESTDKDVRKEATAKINDQLLLAKMAMEDKDSDVRLTALDKLTDQSLIAKIVADGADMNLRQKAMAKITEPLLLADLAVWVNPETAQKVSDREVLMKLATRAWLSAIRKVAVEKVDDVDVLKKVALTDPSAPIRKIAVSKLSDLTVLPKVALNDPAWYVRQAAVAKITDQALLATVIKSDKDAVVRSIALGLITNETVVLEIAAHNDVFKIRMAAAEKLKSQNSFAQLVIETKDEDIQQFANKQITDPKLLDEIAPWLKSDATRGVSDKALLANVAQNAMSRDVRKIAVEKLEDPALLGKVALNDGDQYVRKAAVTKLSDQDLLKTIVTQSADDDVRSIAIEKLSDQATLAAIAGDTNANYRIRQAAMEKVTDQATLARIAGQTNDYYGVRDTAVEKLSDQAALATLAVEDENWSIRREAAKKITDAAILVKIEPWIKQECTKKITDQVLLAKIAFSAKDGDVCKAAVSNLTDQAVLVKIAEESGNTASRQAAVEKISDQAVLARVAGNTNDNYSIRIEAIEKLTDISKLAAIASDTNDSYNIRDAAIKKISDQAVLTRIVRNTSDNSTVRQTALKKLDDQNVLASIATNSNDSIREVAVERLTDQAALAIVAVKDENKNIRQTATRKITDTTILAKIEPWIKPKNAREITDPALLSELALNAKDPDIRLIAVEKLSDQTVLAKVVADDVDKNVRKAAAGKVTSQALLAKLARDDANDDIRKIAFAQLTDLGLREATGRWVEPEFTEKVEDPVLLADIASFAKNENVCQAAIKKLTRHENMAPLVGFEWLSHGYRKDGQNDDAYLALLMGTMLYDKKADNSATLSLTTYNQANELRNQTAVQAGLASLLQKGQPGNKVTVLDLADAANEVAQSALHCREEELVSTVTRAFCDNLTIESSKKHEVQVKYLNGDIPFVSALGLAMLQRHEDWPFIERYLASQPFNPQFSSYLRAMSKNDPEFEKMLLSHPSALIRANALVALAKPAPANEKDMLVRVAGAINPSDNDKTNAISLLLQGLEDERHVVRIMAMRGLIKHGVDAPLEKIKQAIVSTKAWRNKYSLGCMVFTITSAIDSSMNGKQFFLSSSSPSEFAVDGELLQAGYALQANKRRLSDDDYAWLLHQLIKDPGEGGAMFYVSAIPDVDGYRVECAQPRSADKVNSDIADALDKHTSQHIDQWMKAINEVNPYVKLFLVQAAANVASNTDVRAELWRIAEASRHDASIKAYRDKLYTDKVDAVEKTKMWNQTVNYSAISRYADEVVGQITKLIRRMAINHLAANADDEAEFDRLFKLLSDKEGSRAVAPYVLNRNKESILKVATADLLKHPEKEVRMNVAILRLYVEDSDEARKVLTDALQDNEDGVEFAARLALVAKTPALNEVLLSLKEVKPLTVAGYLLRRVEFMPAK